MQFPSKPAVIAESYLPLIEILRTSLRDERPPVAGSRPSHSDVIMNGGEIDICPLPHIIKVCRLSQLGTLEALKKVVGKCEFRPALKGVYFSGTGHAVATNGFVLVETPYEAADTAKGKIIDPRNGNFIDANYPSYTEVLNGQLAGVEHTIMRLHIDTLLAKLKGILMASKFFAREPFKRFPIHAAIPIELGVAMFDPAQLYEGLAALAKLGTAEVDLSFPSVPPGSYSLHRGIIFRDSTIRDRIALVMPLRMDDGISEVTYTYVIPRLALYDQVGMRDESLSVAIDGEQMTKVAA